LEPAFSHHRSQGANAPDASSGLSDPGKKKERDYFDGRERRRTEKARRPKGKEEVGKERGTTRQGSRWERTLGRRYHKGNLRRAPERARKRNVSLRTGARKRGQFRPYCCDECKERREGEIIPYGEGEERKGPNGFPGGKFFNPSGRGGEEGSLGVKSGGAPLETSLVQRRASFFVDEGGRKKGGPTAYRKPLLFFGRRGKERCST